MKARARAKVALTVAGSDSGGGAGIQADLKTFRACGVFGTSAITCVTAQNPARVSAVHSLPAEFVAEQIDRVFAAFAVGGAKTGMLYDAAIIEAVATNFRRRKFRKLVVDPVMVATSGALLLQPDAVAALTTKLLPVAALVTPNLAEAEALSHLRIRTLAEVRTAARFLAEKFTVPVLVKGGHLRGGDYAVDVLFDGREFHEFRAALVRGVRPHGAGCTFSAAIAAQLALGADLVAAIRRAKRFVSHAIRNSVRVGRFFALNI